MAVLSIKSGHIIWQEIYGQPPGVRRSQCSKSFNIKILELQGYLDDFTGKNETIFSQNGSQQSGMTAPIALTRVTLLFIPGTFGTAPCETWSYSRGGTRHYASFKVFSMPRMATKSTTERMVDQYLFSPSPRVISETPFLVSQTRSCSYALRALCSSFVVSSQFGIHSMCGCSRLSQHQPASAYGKNYSGLAHQWITSLAPCLVHSRWSIALFKLMTRSLWEVPGLRISPLHRHSH